MKKSFLAMMVAALFFAVPAVASPTIQVYVDGQAVSFDQPPVIIDDRTLVPMRAIFQALGSEVAWSEPDQTITSTKNGDTLVLKIGDAGLYKNGQLVYTMAVPARIISDRTMVPVRAIAESFDAEVGWDPVGYVITIISAEGAAEYNDSTTIEADDGTTVLSYKMNFVPSNSAYADEIQKTLMAEARAFVEDYGKKAKTEYAAAKAKGNSFIPYSFVGSYEMTRDDSKLISFYGTSTQYTGGSQSVKVCTSHTFSAKTGKELALSDVIEDSEAEIQDFWSSSLGKLIDAKPESFYSDAKSRLERYFDEVGYYVTKDGIAFYLPPETIAPKEAGIVSFTMKIEL
ncbi:MAG: stalk domain-containing protein [Anaerotignum sp.]|nr:stalk domain-containing protein [Anaerotignum sp.]